MVSRDIDFCLGPAVQHSGKRKETFGRVLKQNRLERALSQENLGFDSGYHRTYISFLERGKKTPTLSTTMDFGDTLKVPASEMIRQLEAT
jgi:transcriptional regulator with XRE-family HTH domain